jgi:hypothetical protein
MRRLAADNPAHGRIMSKPLGVVHILISRQTPKRELFMRGASLKNIRSDAFTPAR